jgi:hypothetical protein
VVTIVGQFLTTSSRNTGPVLPAGRRSVCSVSLNCQILVYKTPCSTTYVHARQYGDDDINGWLVGWYSMWAKLAVLFACLLLLSMPKAWRVPGFHARGRGTHALSQCIGQIVAGPSTSDPRSLAPRHATPNAAVLTGCGL